MVLYPFCLCNIIAPVHTSLICYFKESSIQHIATGWPNMCNMTNMLCTTMSRYVVSREVGGGGEEAQLSGEGQGSLLKIEGGQDMDL